MELNNTDNQNYPTFKARIVETPDQDVEGNYRTTDCRVVVNKRTLAKFSNRYYDNWYQFSVLLNSIVIDGQELCIPSNFNIHFCIASEPSREYNGRRDKYTEKVKYMLSLIRPHSDIKFKGVPRKVDRSGPPIPIEPKDIENAYEIYVNEKCIDTVKVEPPTKDKLRRQNQDAQRKAKEKSKIDKSTLWSIIISCVRENKIRVIIVLLCIIVSIRIGETNGVLVTVISSIIILMIPNRWFKR